MDLEAHIGQTLGDWAAARSIATPKFLVAVSGGADSMALCRLVAATQACHAVTVDHGLRHGSAAEARWTCRQLNSAGISADAVQVTVHSMGNVQAAARLARYDSLAKAARQLKADAILTAHTQDDQAETVLARLARGSGTRGLAGMAVQAAVPGHPGQTLLRPLLAVSRAQVRDYLIQKGQRWAEDPSNRDTRFDRVRFRELLKAWAEQGFDAARIAASADNMRRSDDALEDYAQKAWDSGVSKLNAGHKLDLNGFSGLPEDTQLRLLRNILQRQSGDSSAIRHEKLRRARSALLSREAFTLQGCKVTCSKDEAVFSTEALTQ